MTMHQIAHLIDRYDLITLAFLLFCFYGIYHDRPWRRQPVSNSVMRSRAFACAALGMMAYYLLSIINEFNGLLPIEARVAGALVTALAVRIGLAFEFRHNA